MCQLLYVVLMNTLQTIIFYAPLVVILFWGITISFSISKAQNRFKLPFLFFLINAFVAIMIGSFLHNGNYELFRSVYSLGVCIALSMFPLFFLFILSLTKEGGLHFYDYVRHLIYPLVCMLGSVFFLYVFNDHSFRVQFVEEVLVQDIVSSPSLKIAFGMDKFFRMSFILTAVIYFVLTERQIKRQKEAVINYFSNPEDASVKWYSYFRIIYSLTLLASVIYYALNRAVTIEHLYIPSISRFLLAIFFWVIGYYVTKQKLIYTTLIPPRYSTSSNSDNNDSVNDLLLKLEDKFTRQMLFTDSSLTLPILAAELGTNRTYLSRLFNVHLKTSFSAYVNHLRVEYAKELLLDEKSQISSIEVRCGFKSTSNFYKVFSDEVGTSPLKYRKQHQSN